MIVASTVSRRELLKRFGMAGAAAIALPELSRVLLFQREVLAREQAQARRSPGETQTPDRARNWRRWRQCAHALFRPTRTGPAQPKHARRNTSTARSADGLRPRGMPTPRGLPRLMTPHTKRSGRRFVELSAGDQDAVLTDSSTDAIFRPCQNAHDSRHVLRSGLWRQREFRRLGSHRLSGRPARRHGRGSTDGVAGETDAQLGVRLRHVCQHDGGDPCPLTSNRPMSSSSAWARQEEWPCFRLHKPAST